ncbi:N-acetylmannosamine-6-phosphate 2-epimerase [Corynebacterium choanae]|uniref:Putative N-acetylmannosamine-6-phosphate 2-epimerase n=1 Tax=Corynebacterium choanae TaxID=1862358 RepID=A0A3G6J9Q0_9CORY|nr:N-acetylmannosamine-6-phosphate 2-epimerase [Corynebacterium choanae]AZA14639.1 Putative N-acetylmannosamine-6-phosphate 2-epimerase [Corynebacterium choanae]
MLTREEHLAALRHGLVVSCQAYPGEPLRRADVTAAMAQAVVEGGACAVRVQGTADIAATRQAVDVPIIGLIKYGHDGVYITPSVAHARACVLAGADIVAIDATLRPRGNNETFADAVTAIHEEFPWALVMADCASLEDAVAAEAAGADIIGTTLAGYTPGYAHAREKTAGPDVEFIKEVIAQVHAPVLVEGRLHHPEDVENVLALGAYAACVGTAITHPTTITSWFVPGSNK